MEDMVPAISSMVRTIGLSVDRGRMHILHDVDLTVSAGETVAITGPNGAGKSTLLNCLAGALRPTSGRVCWFGSATIISPTVRREIGFVGHQTGLYSELTAYENLVFAARMFGVEVPNRRVRTLLAESGLGPVADRPAGRLSQGMQKRVSIVRGLIHKPPLMLLDEPFVSLDTDARGWLEHLFQQWHLQRRAVCFASHDADQCRRLAHRIIRLDDGRIVAIESTQLKQEPSRRSA